MLVRIRNLSVGFGGPAVLDNADFQISAGERVGLLGRNGAGKSTLMKLVAGDLHPDSGEIERRQGLRIAWLVQEVPQDTAGSVFDVVAEGLGDIGHLLAEYHRVSGVLAGQAATARIGDLDRIQHELENLGGWDARYRVESVLSRLQLDGDLDFNQLSGGLKRRVMLGRALAVEPDLLLLDEPTNHLDIDAIRWLEEFLLGYRGALLFVTHDRLFLQRLATRIAELDRGRLTDWPGDYARYLAGKEAALEVEARENALFDKRLAEEEAWIRQGIKARRTRNEGRVRALQAMRDQRRQRREIAGSARLRVDEAARSGRLVIEARGIGYAYDGVTCIHDLSTVILRGDKVGVIGPNGVGKTTLLRLLLGELRPDQGRVRQGTRLEVAYFDQLRNQLDDDLTLLDVVAEGRERISVNGQSRHAIGYLREFLFSPAQARGPIKALSGGERNRLLLARLFARPSNVLVLDEPTNDLDVETLELLEQLLVEYAGTVLLVSHDRAFLNNVVTSTLVFEGGGKVAEYVGGYDDWLRQRPELRQLPAEAARQPAQEKLSSRRTTPTKLSYKDQRELETLPLRIEELEAEQARLHERLADPQLYQGHGARVAELRSELDRIEGELEDAYARWEALEARKAEFV